MRGGRVYITLNDLMRHIGGTIMWGPDPDQMQVKRNAVTVKLLPHSSTVWVNGARMSLGHSTMRIGNRTYVPVRAFCQLFGIDTQWDPVDGRAYVTYQELAVADRRRWTPRPARHSRHSMRHVRS